MSLLSIGEFAEAVGKTTQTLRNWDASGYLKPAKVGLGGHRYYTQEQVDIYLNNKSHKNDDNKQRKIIGYCQVDNQNQKENLNQQVNNLRGYCYANGYQFEIITDIGLTVNYSRKGFNMLLNQVFYNNVEKVVILNKNSLADSFDLLKVIFNHFNTEIEIIDTTESIYKSL